MQCQDVVLSWPSAADETYIIQYRPTLDAATPWQTLTNQWPAAVDTNLTTFTHSGIVQMANCGGDSFAAMSTGGFETELSAIEELPVEPMAIPMAGGDPVPLAIFPPGMDLSGYQIYDPVSELVVSGALLATPTEGGVQMNSFDLSFEEGSGESGGESFESETGFYRVVRNGVSLFGITNNITLTGYVEIPVEVGITNLEFNGIGLLDGQTGSFGALVEMDQLGRWLLKWDTSLVPNGLHTVQLSADVGPDELPVLGATKIVNIDNNVSSDEFMTTYGSQMWIYAMLKPGGGDYEIAVHDGVSGEYLGSFLGYTPDGVISFTWDLTDGQGNTFTNEVFREDYYFSAASSALASGKNATTPPTWHSAVNNTQQSESFSGGGVLGFLGQLFRSNEPSWSEDDFATAWGEFEYPAGTQAAIDQMMQQAVNNTLDSPLADHPYRFMNFPNGWHTGLSFKLIPTSKEILLSQLADPNFRNFFWYGHGRDNNFGYSFRGPNNERLPGVRISAAELREALGNRRNKLQHAYRFVFLTSCYGGTGDLPRAFGIDPRPLSVAAFQAKGVRPRAMIGATETTTGPFYPIEHQQLGESLAIFFGLWMSETTTVQGCLNAGQSEPGPFEERIPLDDALTINGAVDLRRLD